MKLYIESEKDKVEKKIADVTQERDNVRNRILQVNKEIKYTYAYPKPPKGVPPSSVTKVSLQNLINQEKRRIKVLYNTN